jgi:hypothetical protein
MSGHHEVRVWKIPNGSKILTLPDNWKPFAVFDAGRYGTQVVCRKWVRDETKKEKKESEA